MTTHADLVELARRWLAKRYPLVVTELASGAGEEADAIAFDGRASYLIECKASRSDFLADKRKGWRFHNHSLGSRRWYCAPKDLIFPDELPDMWGLLEVSGTGKLRETIKPSVCDNKTNYRNEMTMLVSLIRRIGQVAPKGVSIRCYTIENKNRATAGIEPNSTEERFDDSLTCNPVSPRKDSKV